MATNSEMASALEERLRLDSAAVAVKIVSVGEEQPTGLLEKTKVLTFCQFVTAAATGGYRFWVSARNLGCANARIAFGMYDPERDKAMMDKAVKTHVGVYARDEDAARKLIASKPALPPGRVAGIAVAPLSKAQFEPDAVLMIVVPSQAYVAMDDYMYATGDAPLTMDMGTNSLVCAYCALQAACFDRISLTPACTGGRGYAGIERTQLTLAFPRSKLGALMDGLEERSRRVSYPGMITMPAPAPLPPKHILTPGSSE